MEDDNIHEGLRPISWLAGRWGAEHCRGFTPNGKEFEYQEDIEFICLGQPMFNYLSISKNPESGKPMHQERGFLRINPGTNELSLIVSHNFGLASIEEGKVDEDKKLISLATVSICRPSFLSIAPYVKRFLREIRLLSSDTLEIILHMETSTSPLSEHLKAVYKKKI